MASSGKSVRWIRPVAIGGLVAAAVAAAVTGRPPGGSAPSHAPAGVAAAARRAAAGAAAASRRPGSTGVAGAYGYPSRCLSVTIPSADRTYARADFNRRARCGRYDGYVTAIFHRVDHAWRPVLVTTAYRCPVASLPASVQAALAVCPW